MLAKALVFTFACILLCYVASATRRAQFAKELSLRHTGKSASSVDSLLNNLKAYIEKQKRLDKYAFNTTSWDFIQATLQTGSNKTVSSVVLKNINATIEEGNGKAELVVDATGTIWGNAAADLHLVVLHDTGATDLDIYMKFDAVFPAFPANVSKNSGSKWFTSVRLTGKNEIEAASATFTDVKGASYTKGLSMDGHFVLESSFPGYAKLLEVTNGKSITGTYSALFPLLSTSPYATLDLDISTPLYFKSKGITATNLNLKLVAASNPEVTLSSDLAVALKPQTVDFHVEADFVAVESLAFHGTLDSTWADAFGLKWLSFSKGAALDFSMPPAKLDFTGDAVLTFSKTQTPLKVSWSVDAEQDSLDFTITATTSILGLEQLFDDVIGKQPPSVNEIGVSGDVTLTLTNFDGTTQEGLTVAGDGLITPTGTIGKALTHLVKAPSLDYKFLIFIPVFGNNQADIEFTLSDPNPIKISKDMTLINAKIHIDILPTPGIDLTAELDAVVKHNPAPLKFDVSGVLGEGQGVDISGSLDAPWKEAFGLKWLDLEALKVDIHFETGMSSFTMSGTADMSFGVNAAVTINFGPPDFEDFTLTVATTIPDLNAFLLDVTGHAGPKLLADSSLQTTITLESTTGLTVDGLLDVNINSPLGKLIKSIKQNLNPLDLVFKVDFFIPVFSQMPATLSFEVQETGAIQLASNIVINGFDLVFDILPSPEVKISTTGSLTLRHQDTPLAFSLSGDVAAATESLSMSGSVSTPWDHPFDIKWLTVDDVSVSFSFAIPTGLQSLSFSMDSELTFSKSTDKLHTSISAENNFMDWQLDVADVAVISLTDVLTKLGKSAPKELDDTTTITNSIDVGLNSATGLSLTESCTIKGALLKKLEIFHTGLQSETFSLSLGLPIFSTGAVTLTLGLPALRINKNMIFTGLQFSLDTSADLSVGAGVKVNFSHNPQLEFDVEGTFNVDGAVSLEGDMVGTWVNMFGIKGFDLSNVEIDIGFDPKLCAVDGCLSAMGLGYKINVGSEDIEMYGYVSIPDVWKLFLESKISGSNGLALSFRDVAEEWNKIMHGHIDINSIPATWGFKDFSFYIAPESGVFDKVYYAAGFQIIGGLDVVGIDAEVNVTVTSDDFNFDVHLSVGQFLDALKHEIGLMSDKPEELIGLNAVTVSGLKTSAIAVNQFPEFYMDYEFFGRHTTKFNFKSVADVADNFHDFFNKYLKKLFG